MLSNKEFDKKFDEMLKKSKELFLKTIEVNTEQEKESKEQYLKAMNLAGKTVKFLYKQKNQTAYSVACSLGLVVGYLSQIFNKTNDDFVNIIIGMANNAKKDKNENSNMIFDIMDTKK